MTTKKTIHNLEWAEFIVEEVFEEVESSPYSLDYNHIDKEYREKQEVSYVTRSALNNGVSNFIADMSEDGKPPIEGNCITIGLDTATVKYQTTSFYTGQNVHIVRDPNLNRYTALFIVPLLEQALEKFGWGGYSATLGRFRQTRFLLPAKDKKPDWAFMESYMKELEESVRPKKKVTVHKITDNRDLQDVKWGQFPIDELFTISSGVRLTKKNMKPGNRPFIGATDSNNGITNFVSNTNNSLDSNVLGVNYNGSVVENFYHPYEALFTDDVKRLHLRNYPDNKYVLLFFKTLILKQKPKYEYGYKFNGKRMSRQIISVPINDHGKPDYLFMEQYMMRMENKLMGKIGKKGAEKDENCVETA